eukprot:6608-Heterococcus_DN1.PRE.1
MHNLNTKVITSVAERTALLTHVFNRTSAICSLNHNFNNHYCTSIAAGLVLRGTCMRACALYTAAAFALYTALNNKAYAVKCSSNSYLNSNNLYAASLAKLTSTVLPSPISSHSMPPVVLGGACSLNSPAKGKYHSALPPSAHSRFSQK